MATWQRVSTRTTNGGWHPYIAAIRGKGTDGWGNTPQEARTKLAENLANEAARARQEGALGNEDVYNKNS